jgi:hypothetical protein
MGKMKELFYDEAEQIETVGHEVVLVPLDGTCPTCDRYQKGKDICDECYVEITANESQGG